MCEPDGDWTGQAVCRDLAPDTPSDPDIFFEYGDEGGSGDYTAWKARLLCVSCPVRRECLTFAFRTEYSVRWGVYGGTLPFQREAVRFDPRRVELLMELVDDYGKRVSARAEELWAGVA